MTDKNSKNQVHVIQFKNKNMPRAQILLTPKPVIEMVRQSKYKCNPTKWIAFNYIYQTDHTNFNIAALWPVDGSAKTMKLLMKSLHGSQHRDTSIPQFSDYCTVVMQFESCIHNFILMPTYWRRHIHFSVVEDDSFFIN